MTLADDRTADWKQRVNDLQRIQYLAQMYAGCAQTPCKFSTNAFVNAASKLVPCLIAQVLCLRSQNAKEAGAAIQMLAEALQDDFESAAFRLLTKDALVKLIHAGKHILAEIGTNTVIGILRNVCSVKVVQRLSQEMQESRSTYVQKISGMFLLEIVSIFPRDTILSLAALFRGYMKHCVTNQNGDCRAFGRKALLIWQQLDHDNSERVFHGVEQAVQRAILEDEFKYAVHAIRGDNLLALTHTVHGNAPPPLPRAASGRG